MPVTRPLFRNEGSGGSIARSAWCGLSDAQRRWVLMAMETAADRSSSLAPTREAFDIAIALLREAAK